MGAEILHLAAKGLAIEDERASQDWQRIREEIAQEKARLWTERRKKAANITALGLTSCNGRLKLDPPQRPAQTATPMPDASCPED